MNACSIKGTPYEKEYKLLGLSEAAVIFVWNANNEQPLDKRKTEEGVIDNPLYQELLAHPISKGSRENALKMVAQSLLPSFTKQYEIDGYPTLSQLVDFLEKKQRADQEKREQMQESINVPTSMSINLFDVEINGKLHPVLFTAEQGQDIYDTIQYLLGENKSWDNVYTQFTKLRDELLVRVKSGQFYEEDPQKLANVELIIRAFDKVKSWYDSKGGMVGEAELEEELGDTEDWKSKDKSQAQRASSSILALVASLPGYRTAIPGEIDFETGEEYQEVTQVQLKSSVTGLPKSGDFQKNWNLLGTSLSGLTTYTEMYEAIEALASRYPQFEYLLKKIPNPRVQGSFKNLRSFLLASEFKRVFSVPEITSVVVDVTKKDDKGNVAVTQQIKGFQPVRNAVSLYDSQYFSYNQRYLLKGVEGNELNFDKIVEDFEALFKNTGSALASKVPVENFLFGARVEELVRFMQSIGLGLSNQDFLKSSNQQGTEQFIAANLSQLKTLYEKIKNVSIINSYLPEELKIKTDKPLAFLRDTIQEIYASKNVLKPEIQAAIEQAIADKKITYGGDTLDKRVKKVVNFLTIKKTELGPLLKFFSQYDAEFRPSSYLNAEDKKKFIRGPWFYLTQQTKVLNSVSNYEELINTPGFERFDYRRNPDMLGSIWLERLFGLPKTIKEIESKSLASYQRKVDTLGNPIQINITNFDGMEIKKFGSKAGHTTTNQHPGDKVFQDFVSFFQSTEVENIRFGDKTSAFSIKWSNPVLREKAYVALNPETMLDPKERTEAEQELINTFKGYLASEAKRVLNLIELEKKDTTYYNQGKTLFIFRDIIPEVVTKFENATTREEVLAAYAEGVALLPTALQSYFAEKSQILVRQLIDIFTTSVNIENGAPISDAVRMKLTVEKLNKLNFINSQLMPQGYGQSVPAITAENLPYIAEIYLKNGFVHNVEFMKMFVGDIANFDKLQKDAREVFKRIPFTSSPGTVFFWDEVAAEFFETDENQDALSRAYTGISNKFGPILKTVIYDDVASFSPEDYEAYKEAYDSGNWDRLSEEEQSQFSEYTNKPKEADAQGVITLDSYRNYLIGINRWSMEQEEAYNKQVRLVLINKELKNNPPNAEELYAEKLAIMENFGGALFPPLKLGHYGPIVEDVKLNALHKFSLVPLVPSVIQGKQLEQQVELMYKNGVNYYTFKSGSKMAQSGKPIKFYKESVNEQGEKVYVINDALSSENITSIHLQNLREQQYQAPKFKGKGTLSTQMMKLVFGDFFEDGDISSDFSESTQKEIKRLYDVFKQNIDDIVTFEKIKLERKLGIKRNKAGEIVDVDQLQMARFFAEALEKKDAPESLRRFIQVNADGTFKHSLDAINNRNQLEELVLNTINNKVISQKINGESYIQVANTGFEDKRFVKPTVEQLKEFGQGDLQFYRKDPVTGETLPMEVKIGFNSKKHSGLLQLEYQGNKVGTLAQLNKILKSNSASAIAWKKKHADKLRMVGVRIPVQGFQSMEYVTVKEFLPETAGAIMILPAQIVVKSGGDFDIDKLTFFETAYDNSGKTYKKAFNVSEYETKLEKQQQLKRTRKDLLNLRDIAEKEIAENEVYKQREDLKKQIKDIQKEIEEAIEAVNDFVDSGFISEKDKQWAEESVTDEQDLKKAFADLDKFDEANDVRMLQVIGKLKKELGALNAEVKSIEEYKKSLTNNLVATLKSVLSQGELYDSLVTPNTNSVLTRYTKPGIKISTTDVFNPLSSWRIFTENILSKDALGIDAKINTLQKEFQRAGLKFVNPLLKEYYFKANKDEQGNILLGGKKSQSINGEPGDRISKVLSEFINGHVDIAKEDWIILLGMDQETSPIAHAMILSGTPIEHILGLINAPIIKQVFEIGNRPEIHKKLDGIRPNKKAAVLALLKANLKKVTEPRPKELVDGVYRRLSQLKNKSPYNQVQTIIEGLLTDVTFNKYITEFNPNQELTEQEAVFRDLAYLMQFYVVLRQQESLRQLTSMIDFNTSNYRTSFQSDKLLEAQNSFKNDFNESAINFMFNDSALAQYNVSSFVQEVMGKVYPLSDSREIHLDISRYISRKGLFKEDDIKDAVQKYKNNILVPYVMMRARDDVRGNFLEYYRGKNGIYLRSTPNNMEQRFEQLLQFPEVRDNFVINNIFIDQESDSREIEFSLKNMDVEENSKAYRLGFLEGLNSTVPEIKSFFEDLALGSYMQYAGSFKTKHISLVIPHEVYVSYTDNAYRELLELKNNDPTKFSDYLNLVRFSTKMALETTGPVKPLVNFLLENYKETAKTIASLTPDVAKVLNNIQKSIESNELSSGQGTQTTTQTSINTTEKTKLEGKMTYSYGANKRSDVTADTTFDAILKGERTATTRYETDGNIDYWKDAKVGDVITWKSGDGRSVDVVVTKALHPLVGSGKTAETWSKLEGWSVDYFNSKVKGKINQAWQIEFKLATVPSSTDTSIDLIPKEDYSIKEHTNEPQVGTYHYVAREGKPAIDYKVVEVSDKGVLVRNEETKKEKLFTEEEYRKTFNVDKDAGFSVLGKFGLAEVYRYTSLLDGTSVYSLELNLFDDENQGKGLGKDIYKAALQEIKKRNGVLTPGAVVEGNKVWESFERDGLLEEGITNDGEAVVILNPNKVQTQTPVETVSPLKDFTNHSGGQLGADIAWDEIGQEFGMVNNKHYWLNNKTPKGNAEITQQDTVEGQQKVTNAARNMGRIEPTHQVRDERLIRNWSQVKYSDAVFAVTTMLSVGDEMNYGKKAKIRQGKGGTGYAIQMAIEAGKPVYVYDQVRKQWFKNIDGKWSSSEVPVLTKNFAGIGTREINQDGLQAIRDVYQATINEASNVKRDLEILENFEDDVPANETTSPENTTTSFTPPKTGPAQLTLKLDPSQPEDDKDNLDDLGFEEDSCEL